MKSLFSGSASIATAVLVTFLIVSARPSVAETPNQNPQSSKNEDQKKSSDSAAKEIGGSTTANAIAGAVIDVETNVAEVFAAPPVSYIATAYSLRGRTASGRPVSKGIIAADRRVLPLGSRVRIEAGGYSGEYLVADTGGMIRGRRIDIWTPSSRDAMRFGRRTVKLTVLSYPGKGTVKTKRAKVQTSTPAATAK